MKHLDQFENYFQEQLEDFESNPEPDSWQKIHDRLHGKRRRFFFWWFFPMSALLMGWASYAYIGKNNNQNQVQISNSNNVSESLNTQSTNSKINNRKQQQTTENNPKQLRDSEATIDNRNFEKININNQVAVSQEIPNITEKASEKTTENVVKNKLENLKSLPFLPYSYLAIGKKTVNPEKITTQLKQPTKEEKTKWIPFVSVAPTYNCKNITPNQGDNAFVNNLKAPAYNASERLGFQAELGIVRQKTAKINLYSALNYQWTPFSLTYDLRQPEISTIDALITQSRVSINKINYATSTEQINENWHQFTLQVGAICQLNKQNQLNIGVGVGKWFGGDKPSGLPLFGTMTFNHRFKNGFSIAPFARYDFKYYETKNGLFGVQPYQFGLKIGLK